MKRIFILIFLILGLSSCRPISIVPPNVNSPDRAALSTTENRSADLSTALLITFPRPPSSADIMAPVVPQPAPIVLAVATITALLPTTNTVTIAEDIISNVPIITGIPLTESLLTSTPETPLVSTEVITETVTIPANVTTTVDVAIAVTMTPTITLAEALPPTPTPTSMPTSMPMPTATPPPPAPTPDGVVRTARIPILMYHYLSVPPADADIYRLDLSVTPTQFAAHLDMMQAQGYTTIGFHEFVNHLTIGTPLPEKPVILTFDDGYRDNYENAFPLLAERGMTATFFIVTDFIYQERPAYVTWEMVREMSQAGMSIESHSLQHFSLANQGTEFLENEAYGTLEAINHEVGVRPRIISYPAGQYDQSTINVFRNMGYWAGVTTAQGATHSSDNLFELLRVRVRGTHTAAEIAYLLALDW